MEVNRKNQEGKWIKVVTHFQAYHESFKRDQIINFIRFQYGTMSQSNQKGKH